jgi:hypothetical protein
MKTPKRLGNLYANDTPSAQDPQAITTHAEGGPRLARRAMLGAGLLVAVLALGVSISNCGTGETQRVVSRPSQKSVTTPLASIPSSTPSPVEAVPASLVGSTTESTTQPEGLPPDVSVSVADTSVVPGQAVEIFALATDDVEGIVLWDGIHSKEAFARDSVSGVWRASYRVPLRPQWERVGLSVTARTSNQRWRRVWLFLNVKHDTVGALEECEH